jgi:hypothetical protein
MMGAGREGIRENNGRDCKVKYPHSRHTSRNPFEH